MNLSPVWVNFFKKNEIDATHWVTIGHATDPDFKIFEYARLNNFVVFTNDLDFGAILAATNANSPSVFQVRSQNLLPDMIGARVVECLAQYRSYLTEGCLITFFDEKSKVRILPLN
jgi:predicted nuclease of predicted toxin-antitoxin system